MRKAQLGKDQADLAYKKLTFERDSQLLEANGNFARHA